MMLLRRTLVMGDQAALDVDEDAPPVDRPGPEAADLSLLGMTLVRLVVGELI